MKLVYLTLKSFFSRILDYIPTTAPQGRSDLQNLVAKLVSNYSPPMSERDVTWVVCTILQRLEPLQGKYSVHKYSLALKRAAAGQVGVMIMQELKDQQNAEFAAAQAAASQLAAVPAPPAADVIQDTTVSTT